MPGHKPRNSNFTTIFIVPVLAAMATAAATVAVSRYFENKELSSAKTKIETLSQENDKLNRDWILYTTDKGASTKRPISYQLERLRSHLAKTDKDEKRQHTVEILGINALGPIHQGKRILSDLLLNGGRLQVLLLDPESKAWEVRLVQETDVLHYNTTELLAALYGLSEINNRVLSSGKGTLEVQMHAQNPDRSLIIVDRGFADGFVMGNRYPPNNQNGKEGLEGESYVERADIERGKDDLNRFDELWRQAVSINLPSQPFTPTSWPFKKQKPPDGK